MSPLHDDQGMPSIEYVEADEAPGHPSNNSESDDILVNQQGSTRTLSGLVNAHTIGGVAVDDEHEESGLLTEEFKESIEEEKANFEDRDNGDELKTKTNAAVLSQDVPQTNRPRPSEQETAPEKSPRRPSNHKETTEAIKESKTHRMHKFSLYETQSRYYLVGGDVTDTRFRILKIDRTAPLDSLVTIEDEIIYTKKEMDRLLNTIEDGNRSSGGMKLRANTWGLLGFIRFTDTFYMVIITKKQQVAMVGGHYIYQVDGTELVPLNTGNSSIFQSNRNPEEARFLAIFNNLDLQQSFYFSYSYDISRTLQHNISKLHRRVGTIGTPAVHDDLNKMFVWNNHLLSPATKALKNAYDWCMPIIHGFIDQSSVDVFGRSIYITLIARRSRFFAGARFLKRGANDLGYVANDVETEQIVADMLVTPFDTFTGKPLRNPNYTSFVQHRGSIPLYWTQDSSGVTPKPAIDLNLIDPFYTTAALHFDNLFERYGAPVVVLNLVKARERTPRESKLLVEYQNAINYLNQSLPDGKKILYRAYDMSRAAKTRGQDVIGTLEKIAEEVVDTTGFFANDSGPAGSIYLQNGVVRSNCIDCLDRTNAAQFVVGKRALARQLQALGVIAEDFLNYDSDSVNLFAHMLNDHGDTLASQYGGSHLVNTTDSYRKINNWQSHSRDMLESFKRYYHNSFLDSQRQEAYNLFLGNYVFAQGQPMLWELPNDYYLHHAIPSSLLKKRRKDYINWFTPEFLDSKTQSAESGLIRAPGIRPNMPDDWWHEYYRPSIVSSFLKVFAYRMNSTTRYLPKNHSAKFNMSPFCVRKHAHDNNAVRRRDSKDTVTIADSNNREVISPLSASTPPQSPAKRISSLQQWLNPVAQGDDSASAKQLSPFPQVLQSAGIETARSTSSRADFKPADKTLMNQWTLGQFHSNSLHPSVSAAEAAEYERYTTHPLRLPLVVSNELPAGEGGAYREFLDYLGPHVDTTEGEVSEFAHWTHTMEDPLAVTDHDLNDSKRYAAYRKWLRGKSLFKQSKVDPEYLP